MTLSNPVLVAVGIYVAYVVVVAVVWRVNGVHYLHLADDRRSVVRGIVVPIGLGALLLAVATSVLGWWHPVLFDDGRTGPGWALAVPVLFAIACVLGLATIDWRSEKRSLLPALAVGTLLVGFAEEVLTRGLLVEGARQAGWSALGVFLLSTLLFSALHALNAFFGVPLRGTLVQLALTFVAGAAFYVMRLSTGTLLVGILLHAAWDFTTLGAAATGRTPKPATLAAVGLCYLATLAALVVMLTGS
jgi:membrane protease YdiL (CAAX protease family)